MPTLRDCIGRAGKLLNPTDAAALHQRAEQYVKDGRKADEAERMAVEFAVGEAEGQLDSIYRQAGVKRGGKQAATPAVAPPATAPGTPQPPTDVPAPAITTDSLPPDQKAKIDRVASEAERIAALPEEQREAEVAKLEAELLSNESQNQPQAVPEPIPDAPPERTEAAQVEVSTEVTQPIERGDLIARLNDLTALRSLRGDGTPEANKLDVEIARTKKAIETTPREKITPVDIGPRDASVSTGTGVATAKEEAMLKEQRRLVEEHLSTQRPAVATPTKTAAGEQATPAAKRAKPAEIELQTPEEAGITPSEKAVYPPSNAQKRFGQLGLQSPSATPEAVAKWKGELKAYRDQGKRAKDRTEKSNAYWHGIADAVAAKRPISTEAAEFRYPGKGPEGYVKQGERWVPKDAAETPSIAAKLPEVSTPPAQMKRPALRAELEAAGITEVGGQPLDQAAPNQLMAAVGKLRREGKPEAVPEKRLGQRAIDALEKAKVKIDPKDTGRVSAGVDPVLAAKHAYNGALSIAQVAIRTGMKVNDVVRLALARYKALHPKHTPAELTQVETDIRAALSEPPPEPKEGQKKSLLPESLKAAGAPVESITYQVRSQAQRKNEAADYIRTYGPKKAEARIEDKNVPGDERVAIGGELINERMLALQSAKPEDVAKITNDIQRITARMQPELATQAGQTVAMFGGIYDDVRVASGIEYARSQNEKFKKDLGGEETEAAVKDVKSEVEKAKTPQDVDKAIEALKKKHTTKPARKVLDGLQKQVEKVMELKRIGALDNEALADLAGKELKLNRVDPARMKRISELAERVHKAQTPAEKAKAELDLVEAMGLYKSGSVPNILSALYTANILSGPTTQGANIGGTAMQTLTNLGVAAATNPKRIRPILDGFIKGLPLGLHEAHSILRTGRATRDFQDKTGGTGNILNAVDVARDYPKVPQPLADIATGTIKAVEKVFRFMKAVDATFYYPAREAYARLAASKIIDAKLQGPEQAAALDKFLHTTPEAFRSAQVQAQREGYSGIDLGRRVADIIEERRSQTPDGAKTVKESENFAAQSTFTQEPEGFAGVIYHGLKYMVDEGKLAGFPVLKPVALFLKTPTNVFNEVTNYLPGVGVLRSQAGMRGPGFKNAPWRNFSKDERNAMYVKQLIGGVLLGGLLTKILNDDEVDITARGPSNASQRRQWRDGGGIPYSIGIGGKRLSYKDSPFLLPLAIVGNVADSVRYQKSKADMVLSNRVVDAVARSPQVIFDLSMLTGMADLMEGLSGGQGGMQGIARTMGSIPANLVIPYNRALQQIDQAFDSQSYKNDPVTGSIPFLRRTGEPLKDVQGRPQTYSPSKRFGSTESDDQVDALLRDRNLYIPEIGRDQKIGNRVMAEDEHAKYRTLSGQRIRVRLQAMAPIIRNMNQEDAQNEIEKIAREERANVKSAIGLTAIR